MNLPKHIIDEADAFTASQLYKNWFVKQPRVDHSPALFDFFAAGAAWQQARSDMDKQPPEPTALEILQRNLDLCQKHGNKSEVMVLTKEQIAEIIGWRKAVQATVDMEFNYWCTNADALKDEK